MNQDAKAKIAKLESDLLRWKSAHSETEKNLQKERDYYRSQVAKLRTSRSSFKNECQRLRDEINDLKRLLDKERQTHLDRTPDSLDLQTPSSSRSQRAVSITPEVITVDSDSEDDIKSNPPRGYSINNERTSTPSTSTGDRHRSVFAGVELKATSMLRQSLNSKPPETTLSERAFGKSNADHLSAESPKKKPKVQEEQKPLSTITPRNASPSLDSLTGITSPEIEAEASMQPKHAVHIPSSATLGPPPTRMSVMEDNGRASPLLSGSTSDSLSDRTPGLSEVEDASGEEEADEQVPPIPGPSRISGRPRILRPSVSVPQAGGDIRSKYLQGVPNFSIHPLPSTTRVSREFLNYKFGGGEMQFTGVMNKIGNQGHPVLFPQQHYNPLMPSTPGDPGLIYTSRSDLTDEPVWRIFRPIKGSSKPALWEYLGDYSLAHVGNLTHTEFRSQLQRVQNRLMGAIIKFNWDGYIHMRARIFLRKNGREVNDTTVQNEINKFKTKAKCHYGNKLTKADIQDALECGDETISVLLMTCVGYDHKFAKDFSSFKDYAHRPPPARGSKAAKKSAQRRSPSMDSDSRSASSNESFKADGSGDEAGEHEQVRRQRPLRKRNAPQRFVVDVDDPMGSDTS